MKHACIWFVLYVNRPNAWKCAHACVPSCVLMNQSPENARMCVVRFACQQTKDSQLCSNVCFLSSVSLLPYSRLRTMYANTITSTKDSIILFFVFFSFSSFKMMLTTQPPSRILCTDAYTPPLSQTGCLMKICMCEPRQKSEIIYNYHQLISLSRLLHSILVILYSFIISFSTFHIIVKAITVYYVFVLLRQRRSYSVKYKYTLQLRETHPILFLPFRWICIIVQWLASANTSFLLLIAILPSFTYSLIMLVFACARVYAISFCVMIE